MDADLTDMSRAQLVAEVARLRDGIRRHRDSIGQELCWHHPALWALLPETTDPSRSYPSGPSSCAAACGTASHSTSKLRTRRGRSEPYPG